MSKIIGIDNGARFTTSVSEILERVPSGIKEILVIGFTENGGFYSDSTYMTDADALWMLEMAKLQILRKYGMQEHICDGDEPA